MKDAGLEGDYLFLKGSVFGALMYSELYMPRLVEIEGSVLLADNQTAETQQRFAELRSLPGADPADLEQSFNLIELVDWIDHAEAQDEDVELLAQTLAMAWQGWLKLNYPDRTFVIEATDPEDDGFLYGVTMYERR